MNEIIRRFAEKENISFTQAKAVYDISGYDCFKWHNYKGNIIIFSEPKYKKHLKGYRDNIMKYSNCGEIIYLPTAKSFGFLIKKGS